MVTFAAYFIFAAALLFAFTRRQKSKYVSAAVTVLAICGLYALNSPWQAKFLARLFDVPPSLGLLAAIGLMIAFAVIVDLYQRQRALLVMLTIALRKMTLMEADRQTDDND